MKTLPTLVTAMNARAREVFGEKLNQTSIAYQIVCDGQAFWHGQIFLSQGRVGHDWKEKNLSFCGATPREVFDKAMASMDLA